MNDDISIRVENLGKLYRIGEREPYKTLRDSLARSFRRWRHLGSSEKRDQYMWALKGVSFKVSKGEVVGIIGTNGAGKSTLLKILSRITEPTEGYAEVFGRVGSLLEIGTGFHPELTGRDNVYLSGAILGMKKREIKDKFNDIVAFAEIEKFINTPVKYYSSGMYVRLAFAVAAHLEPEILLVDEVLAVGDAAFQKKCLGKMSEVAREGRTVLFVSHNMGAVGRLCRRGFVLDQGRIAFSGGIAETIEQYVEGTMKSGAELHFEPDENKRIQIRTVRLLDHLGRTTSELDRECPLSILIEYEVRQRTAGAHVGVMLDRLDGTPVCHAGDIDQAPDGILDREPGFYRTIVEFPGGLLNASSYQIRIGIAKYGGDIYDYCEGITFRLLDHGSFASMGAGGQQRLGVLAIPLTWKTEKLG